MMGNAEGKESETRPAERVLVQGAEYAITVDAERRIVRDASISIEAGRIVAVGPAAELGGDSHDLVIDARGKVVTPGFVNCHDHLYPQVMRGIFLDELEDRYIPDSCAVRAAMTEEEEYVSTLASVTEFLANGTTCILNPGDSNRLSATVRALADAGVRAIIGANATDRENSIGAPVLPTAEAVAQLRAVLDEYRSEGRGLIQPWVMLAYAQGQCSPELAQAAKQLADEYGVGLTFHQSARTAQVELSLAEHGVRPLRYLDDLGVLGDNVLLGHAIQLDDEELTIMAATGTAAAMCPVTSLRMGFGTTRSGRLPEMLERGIRVGLGTDTTDFGPGDMLRAVMLAATLYKDSRQDTAMVPAEVALELGTIGGAAAVGLGDEIGAIEAGRRADLVLFDASRSEWRPLLNPVNNLVYNADGRSVDTVLVDGRVLIENGRATFVDEDELQRDVQRAAEALLARTGVRPGSRWPTVGGA